jgi:hypothetical protein
MEKKGVIKNFNRGNNICYVDNGRSMKVSKWLKQLSYGELKVGDSYLVDASYGANAVDNLKKCKLKEIRGHGSSYNFIFELTEYDEDLKIMEKIAHSLQDNSIAYTYDFKVGVSPKVLDEIDIDTKVIKPKSKDDMLFYLTINSNGEINSFKINRNGR